MKGSPPPATRVSTAVSAVLSFPGLVLLGFLVLTATSINGTSSGALWDYLFGSADDPRLLLGGPRPIRSDEWLVNTPHVIGQVAAGLPRVNENLAGGLDMSVVFDVPYLDWSLLFRPHSWAFLVLPLDQAYAFKWWLLPVVGLICFYVLARRLGVSDRLICAGLALALIASPFGAWWFTTTTFGSLAWATAALLAFVLLLQASSRRGVVLSALFLAYSTTCFALVLYPPFQVPCVLVVLAASLGILVERWPHLTRRDRVVRLGATSAALAAAVTVVVVFFLTRQEAVEAITGTAYPGRRVADSGGYSLVRLFFGAFSAPLQLPDSAGAVAPEVGGNESEASAYLLVGLFLSGVVAWLVVRARRREWRQAALPAALLAVGVVFLAHLFLVAFTVFNRPLLLFLVPTARMHLGLGFLSVLLLLAVSRHVQHRQLRAPFWLASASAALVLVVLIEVGIRARRAAPELLDSRLFVLLVPCVVAALVYLFARGRLRVAVGVLVLSNVVATAAVNPLYRGVLDIRTTDLGRAIQAQDDGGAWVSTAGILGNAVLTESAVHTYSAVLSYPTAEPWDVIDPGGEFRDVYNRYAHVIFQAELQGDPVQTPQLDVVLVDFDPCGAFAQGSVTRVLTENVHESPCLKLLQAVDMPARTFHIYEVVRPVTTVVAG